MVIRACRLPEFSLVQSLEPRGDTIILWANLSIPLFLTEVAPHGPAPASKVKVNRGNWFLAACAAVAGEELFDSATPRARSWACLVGSNAWLAN